MATIFCSPVPRRGRLEAALQQRESTLAQPEVQIVAILEIHIQQRARDARAARHLVHGQRIETLAGRHGFGGIEDLGAPAILLFLATFSDIVHAKILARR